MASIKVGKIFYSCFAYSDDEGKVITGIDEWVVRTIRNKKQSSFDKLFNSPKRLTAFLVRKTEFTWLKQKKGKDVEFAWSKNISKFDKKEIEIGSENPIDIYTTKRQAILSTLKWENKHLPKWKSEVVELLKIPGNEKEVAELQNDINESEKIIKALKTRLTKLKKTS